MINLIGSQTVQTTVASTNESELYKIPGNVTAAKVERFLHFIRQKLDSHESISPRDRVHAMRSIDTVLQFDEEHLQVEEAGDLANRLVGGVERFELYAQVADQGCATALYYLSPGEPDPSVRSECLRKAAEKGFSRAQVKFGASFLDGAFGVTDVPRAIHLFQQAASQGDPGGLTGLATCYMMGLSFVKDVDKAIGMFEQAAAQGDPGAQVSLFELLLEGNEGVAQDVKRACKLLKRGCKGLGLSHPPTNMETI